MTAFTSEAKEQQEQHEQHQQLEVETSKMASSISDKIDQLSIKVTNKLEEINTALIKKIDKGKLPMKQFSIMILADWY